MRASPRSGAAYRYRIHNRLPPLTHQLGLALAREDMSWTPAPCTRRHRSSSATTTSRPSATTRCQAKSPEKTLEHFSGYRDGEFVIAECSQPVFPAQSGPLYGRDAQAWSVRAGGGEGDITRALAARDRKACGPVAPADGLIPDAGRLPARRRWILSSLARVAGAQGRDGCCRD
jgi:tRNA pseudouridine38-40 synthase